MWLQRVYDLLPVPDGQAGAGTIAEAVAETQVEMESDGESCQNILPAYIMPGFIAHVTEDICPSTPEATSPATHPAVEATHAAAEATACMTWAFCTTTIRLES